MVILQTILRAPLQGLRCRWRCSHGVSAVCCMYRDERVIFVVNAACLLCFFPPLLLCTDLRCVWFLCTCWGCVSVCVWKTEQFQFVEFRSVIAWASVATGEQANECLKQKNKGRKEGGQGLGEGKTYPCTVEDGPGRRLTPSFNS